jgi:3-hydroxyacyl-CoA dehydrogenase / enoyl-CoA hydratase / 3-hydroxybutyryl-CoA epimerase
MKRTLIQVLKNGTISEIVFDGPKSTNTIDESFTAEFEDAVDEALAGAPSGILLRSTKQDFIAGADLEAVLAAKDAAQIFSAAMRLHRVLRRLETSKVPVAAALCGSALGGGLEIALAAHYRVAVNKSKARFGLPEVTLGLIPGAGGTQRLPRLIGIQESLALMLEGKRLSPEKALKAGLIHAVVPEGAEVTAARDWLVASGAAQATQPWDRPGYRMPGGAVQSANGMQIFAVGNAMLAQKTFNCLPAARLLMSAVYEGLQVRFDVALRIEARKFTEALLTPTAKRMVKTLFFALNEAAKLASRPAGVPLMRFEKVAVLGAGLMGAGIAMVHAQRGVHTVLLDTSLERAVAGKRYTQDRLELQVTKGVLDAAERDQILSRIHPTEAYADLDGCSLVIEAVFEDPKVKAAVTQKALAAVGNHVLFASNTSTLPITSLASASERPDLFIGLHFFSPVEKMPLIEVILGKHTSEETLAHALDYVAQVRKTPIVVRDTRGFYTSRVFATYVHEGLALLKEGVAPAVIERAGRLAGMPVGPLALADEVAIDLFHKVLRATQAELGADFSVGPGDSVIIKMVEEIERLGKKTGRGFYDYPEGSEKTLWPGLAELYPPIATLDIEVIKKRLINIQVLEAFRCLQQGTVLAERDLDVGAILGWGFAPTLGGPVAYVDSVGASVFVDECRTLASEYGDRFTPPQVLVSRSTTKTENNVVHH